MLDRIMNYQGIATLKFANISLPVVNYNISYTGGEDSKCKEAAITVLLADRDIINNFPACTLAHMLIESPEQVFVLEKAIISRMTVMLNHGISLADTVDLFIIFDKGTYYPLGDQDLSE